jgi:hypothetical protein
MHIGTGIEDFRIIINFTKIFEGSVLILTRDGSLQKEKNPDRDVLWGTRLLMKPSTDEAVMPGAPVRPSQASKPT